MTVERPRFDAHLESHMATVLETDDKTLCHAVLNPYTDPEAIQHTECGIDIPDVTPKRRKDFADSEPELCRDCWPDDLEW
jgi:hypothetical protein